MLLTPVITDNVPAQKTELLRIEDLRVAFCADEQQSFAVRGAHVVVRRGEICALVGESGSGKSVTALAVLGLLPEPGTQMNGRIFFDGEEISACSPAALQRLRGGRIAMIFQEPLSALNPLHPVGRQIAEAVRVHQPAVDAKARTLHLLEQVEMPEPFMSAQKYPHQLSGGQRQRVMIAMALANDPQLLIADEPTTALDVTIQAQILDLLVSLTRKSGMSVLLISHDLGVVRHVAERVYIMRKGKIVEHGEVPAVFSAPQHAYTRRLLACSLCGKPEPLPADSPELLQVEGLRVAFGQKRGFWRKPREEYVALEDVSFGVRTGESLGIVGESGAGKTTLGLALLRLLSSTGRIRFAGQNLEKLDGHALRAFRREAQIVFQDPFGSLSPRMTVAQIVGEGLDVHKIAVGAARERLVGETLDAVGISASHMHRYPHEFSGGQRQRICIARALVLRPRLLVLDEPTSALDRSVQFQIVEVLREIRRNFALTYIFITHDLSLVRALCHRVLIMRGGRVVEAGATERVFAQPREDYTRTLLAAALPEHELPGCGRSAL